MTASKFAWSQPPSASPNPLDYSLQVHIFKIARSWPPSSQEHGLQVRLQTRSITASGYIIQERQLVYRDTGVTEVDRVMGSIYSADPGVDRHHPISISSYHTMKIHTLSYPTFGLTRCFRDFVAACNCVAPQHHVISYVLT